MKIKPLGKRILVQRDPLQEKTAAGIFIQQKEMPQTGKVIALGTHYDINPLPYIKEGDTVYFGKYSGIEAGHDIIIFKEDELLGVIESSNIEN